MVELDFLRSTVLTIKGCDSSCESGFLLWYKHISAPEGSNFEMSPVELVLHLP
jgi:hypothetical protein